MMRTMRRKKEIDFYELVLFPCDLLYYYVMRRGFFMLLLPLLFISAPAAIRPREVTCNTTISFVHRGAQNNKQYI